MDARTLAVLEQRRLRSYMERAQQAARIGPLATLLLVWISWSSAHVGMALAWVALVGLGDLATTLHTRAYFKAPPLESEVARWRRRQIMIHAGSAAMWGICGWMLHDAIDAQVGFGDPHLLWLVGVFATNLISTAAIAEALPVFIVALWTPTVVSLMLRGGVAEAQLLAGIALLSVVGYRVAQLAREQLDEAVRSEVELVDAKKQLEAALQALTRLASRDALTDVLTRGYLTERLTEIVALAHRQHSAEALVFVDLDRFKAINDAYGHAGGDQVLKHVANVLRRSVRATDLVGRWGGEEFVVVLRGANDVNGAKVAEILRRRLSSMPVEIGATKISVTASFGVAGLAEREDLDAWVGRADAACYRAKFEGRNRVVANPTPGPREHAPIPLRTRSDTADPWFRTE